MRYRKKSLNNSRVLLFLGLFLLGLFYPGNDFIRAEDRRSLTVEVSIPPIQKIAVYKKSFPEISARDFIRGYIELKEAVTLTVSSNVPWRTVIFTNSVNLYTSPGKFKSVSDFKWRTGDKPFRPVSAEPVVVMEGKGGTKDYNIFINYRLELDWKDTPPGSWQFLPEFRIEHTY